MAWIKRNLYFAIGSVIALALMIFGAFILWTQISQESELAGKIKAQYAELTRLNNLNPHPGDEKIDNIKAARDQQADMRAYIAKLRPFYQPIPSIPESTNKISNADFAAQLRNTVALLRRNATNQSVVPPPDYYFTFESQRKIMLFNTASLPLLAVQLGEIKAICDILFDAKINSLVSMRRESVSSDDSNPSDYLPGKTVSTPLADLSPYEVTFQCFSTELSQVLSSLASSPNGFIVKTVNIEPASAVEDMTGNQAGPGMQPNQPAQPFQPMPNPIPRRRFEGGPGGFNPPPNPAAPPAVTPGRVNQAFLNERPFRVTLRLVIVKLKPASASAPAPAHAAAAK